jgi:hypothetical protein
MMYYEKKDFHPLNSKFMQRRENRERERERESRWREGGALSSY